MKRECPTKSQIPTRRQGMSSATSKPSPQKLQRWFKTRRRALQKIWRPTAADPNKRRNRIYSKNHGNLIRLRKTITRSILLRNNPNENVINLSKYSFTNEQYSLLNKKLNFFPTPWYYNKEELKQDIKSFTRKIKSRGHFYDSNENQQADQVASEPVIKCKSNWELKKNHHTVETIVEVVENNAENILQKKNEPPRNNLSTVIKLQ